MIRCLIIKTSSLGDIIHTLPALTDAVNAIGDIQFDWVVEENYSEIPAWHPSVRRVIPIAIRRWRKNILKTIFGREWQTFKQQLKAQHYDVIIDAQGLLKSAVITRFAHGSSYGMDKNSAREPLAAKFYHHPLSIAKDQHAVERVRQLFAKALSYELAAESASELSPNIDYGIKETFNKQSVISKEHSEHLAVQRPKVLFFHGTTWETKHWPESHWLELARQLSQDGYEILLPWGNALEKERAETIKNNSGDSKAISVLAEMTLREIVEQLSQVSAVVAVDTGLAHLAAALDKPQVSLFGPTDPDLTRPYGHHQVHLQVDYPCKACLRKHCNKTDEVHPEKNFIKPICYNSLTPDKVKQALYRLLERDSVK